MEERVQTHFESVTGWRVLWAAQEVLWYSQRDDWGQLYLYVPLLLSYASECTPRAAHSSHINQPTL